MKKRRRIEITTFCSRTTITVRNQDQSAEPSRNADSSGGAFVTLPQAEDGDLKPPQIAQYLPADLGCFKPKE